MDIRELLQIPGVLPTDPGDNRVLVVDDDLSLRMSMVRALRREGYDCHAATSTAEARHELRRGHYGLVITDLRMFAEDGIELVREVSDRYRNTYSIVVSGFVTDDDADRIRRA